MTDPSIEAHRILDPDTVPSLARHIEVGGGVGLDNAATMPQDAIVDTIRRSGLRGRGGAAFPTAVKWEAAMVDRRPSTVVVNAAEGEPGSFKDRTLLRRNPYRVLEGAVITALAVGANRIVIGTKRSFLPERRRLSEAIVEFRTAGWLTGLEVEVVLGPDLYLFGEETAMLEVAAGRPPFPRVAPPFRRGLADDRGVAEGTDSAATFDAALLAVNNVETLAHVAWILANGVEAFRSEGTEAAPGTILCTVSGDTVTHGVAEVPLGTPVRDIIDHVGGGCRPGHEPVALLSGVSHPFLPADRFDVPAAYDDLADAGSGLGAAGFVVFDDSTDLVGAAEGVARFLAVQSCGQCEPCKRDGSAIADLLGTVRRGEAEERTITWLDDRLRTVDQGARCYLAIQHRVVIDSLLARFPAAVAQRMAPGSEPAEPLVVTELDDIRDGRVVIDRTRRARQPDWGFGPDSGQSPADRFERDERTLETRTAFVTDHAPGDGRGVPAVPDHDHRRATAVSFGTGAPGSGGGADGTTTSAPIDDEMVIDLRRQVDDAHHELLDAFGGVAGARPASPARDHAIDRFEATLTVHTRAVDQVLLPMARRVAPEAGEAAGERSERDEASTAALVARLRDDHEDRENLGELAGDVRRLIADEDQRVMPILERHLSDAELDDLGRAFHEARLVAEPMS